MRACVIDIETNNLLSEMIDFSSFPYKIKEDAKLWCVVITDVETGKQTVGVKDQITKDWMRDSLLYYDCIVQHNGLKFDLLALKLFGVLDYKIGWIKEKDTVFGRECTFVDTLIMSRLFSPDRFGGHSLEVWGERLGEAKTNFRKESIEAGIIPKDSPKGHEFRVYSDLMVDYCRQDTVVGVKLFLHLLEELQSYSGWKSALKMEHKLADLAIKRESLGFWFDKDLALRLLEDLTEKMKELQDKVNPLLPPKPMNKTELNQFSPPKNQLKKDLTPSSHMLKFAEKVGGEVVKLDDSYVFGYKGNVFSIPFTEPVETHVEADISHLDHVKQYLVDLGWDPSEWAIRDLTKDSKKQSLPYEKRVAALDRWFKETISGKFSRHRLQDIKGKTVEEKYNEIKKRLDEDYPVRVFTSPKVRVGVVKELCPKLVELGDKVAFAKDFALFLTYKHRKSSIAGGDLEDVDFDEEYPNT